MSDRLLQILVLHNFLLNNLVQFLDSFLNTLPIRHPLEDHTIFIINSLLIWLANARTLLFSFDIWSFAHYIAFYLSRGEVV